MLAEIPLLGYTATTQTNRDKGAVFHKFIKMSTVSAVSSEGSAHLQKACNDACSLLDKFGHKDAVLNEGRFQVERPVNKYLVKSCQGLVFQWTVKAGLGLGITHGHGFMIHKTDHKAGTWSAPCFIKFSGGKIGALIGVEQVRAGYALQADTCLRGRLCGPACEAQYAVSVDAGYIEGKRSFKRVRVPRTQAAHFFLWCLSVAIHGGLH